MSAGGVDAARVLAEPVFAGGRSKPFGEMTGAEVADRARELRSVVGFGPTARVAPVARAWAALASEMDRTGAARVGELDADVVAGQAAALWVSAPPGGLMTGG